MIGPPFPKVPIARFATPSPTSACLSTCTQLQCSEVENSTKVTTPQHHPKIAPLPKMPRSNGWRKPRPIFWIRSLRWKTIQNSTNCARCPRESRHRLESLCRSFSSATPITPEKLTGEEHRSMATTNGNSHLTEFPTGTRNAGWLTLLSACKLILASLE